MRRLTLASAFVLLAFNFALGEELIGTIRKVEDGKIHFEKKGPKKAEEMILTPAKDIKVYQAVRVDPKTKKLETDEFKDGLKNEKFTKIGPKGIAVRLLLDDQSRQIREIRLLFHQPMEKSKEKK